MQTAKVNVKSKGKAKRKMKEQIGIVQTAQIEQAQAAGPTMDEENAMPVTAFPDTGSGETNNAQIASPAMEKERAMQEEPQVQLINLNRIVCNTYNPRKDIREESLLELAASIRQSGVLQPICARPKGETFEIVYGERRFWAAAMAELRCIPAIVREMTDAEAEDAAITENLQREDVKPMEEAAAYKRCLESGRHTIESLIDKFGKSESYIRSRLKLNVLIPELAEQLDKEEIAVGVAVEIAKYDAEVQQEVFQEHFTDGCRVSWKNARKIEIAKRLYERYMTKLETYRFDKTECQSCQHNTANQVLFLEACEGGCAGCQNRECMIRKNEEYLARKAVRLLKEDPRTVLAADEETPSAVIELLSKEGYHIEELEYYNDYYNEGPEMPEEPTAETFASEEAFYDAKESYEAEMAYFMEATRKLEFDISEGRMRKYAIIGPLDIDIRYEELEEEEKTVTIEDAEGKREVLVTIIPPSPVEGMRQKDHCNREWCYEHITEDMKRALVSAKVTNKPLQKEEQQMFHYAVMRLVNSSQRLKQCGFRLKANSYMSSEEMFSASGRITPKQQAALMRTFLLDFFRAKAPDHHCTEDTLDTRLMVRFADLNIPEKSKTIQQEYLSIYEKRKARLQEQIDAIVAQQEAAAAEASAQEEPGFEPEEIPAQLPEQTPVQDEPQQEEPTLIPIEPDFEPDTHTQGEVKIAA